MAPACISRSQSSVARYQKGYQYQFPRGRLRQASDSPLGWIDLLPLSLNPELCKQRATGT